MPQDPKVHRFVARKSKPCPICSAMSTQRFFPFCSKRCADVDLGRWLGGIYRVPAVEPPEGIDPADLAPGTEPGPEAREDEA